MDLFLLLRAPVELPPASDAGIGDTGDHEAGELPRDLHAGHEVHHGRIPCGPWLLRPSRDELCWPVLWWRSWKVSLLMPHQL